MGDHGYMPSQRRRNVITERCFQYVRQWHPAVFEDFKKEAEERFPPVRGGRHKNANTQEILRQEDRSSVR